ncbi:hypothetical protein VUR80DRAFT_3799 [Thermomyces stellatus]
MLTCSAVAQLDSSLCRGRRSAGPRRWSTLGPLGGKGGKLVLMLHAPRTRTPIIRNPGSPPRGSKRAPISSQISHPRLFPLPADQVFATPCICPQVKQERPRIYGRPGIWRPARRCRCNDAARQEGVRDDFQQCFASYG